MDMFMDQIYKVELMKKHKCVKKSLKRSHNFRYDHEIELKFAQ